MADLIGSLHFLILVGLTGACLEQRMSKWPQWTASLGLVLLFLMTVVYATAVAIGYGAI